MVIVAGAAGAFLGDNFAYSIGHRSRRASSAARPQGGRLRQTAALGRARQIRERGGLLLITARFIPGGRTALTLSSGITRQKPLVVRRLDLRRRALIWAGYAAGLAYADRRGLRGRPHRRLLDRVRHRARDQRADRDRPPRHRERPSTSAGARTAGRLTLPMVGTASAALRLPARRPASLALETSGRAGPPA